MNEYISNVQELNNSMQLSSLEEIINSLDTMGDQMNDMPDLQEHLDNMVKLNETLDSLHGPLNSAIVVMQTRPPKAPPGYNPSPFLDGVINLNGTMNTRPNNTELVSNLGQCFMYAIAASKN